MTASKSLPARPSLESLRKQAKKLARDIAAGDAGAIARARVHLPKVELPLSQRNAQLVLAREYGFAGWRELTEEVSRRLGTALEWAALQARRVIHDNDVERLKRLLAEYPALLSWRADDHDGGLLGMATDAYGDAFDPHRERQFTRAACAELLIDAGAVVMPSVCTGLLASRARGLLQMFQRNGLLPRTLEFVAALGDLDAVRTALEAHRDDPDLVRDAFVCACRFEHEAVASLLLERCIALDSELGTRVDGGPGRRAFLACFLENRPAHASAVGLWKAFVMEQITRSVREHAGHVTDVRHVAGGDLTAFVGGLQREAWLLGDEYVWFQAELIGTATLNDREALLVALLDLDPAILRRRPPPPSQAIEFALTYAHTHLLPLLTRIWPLPDDLPHAAGIGDLARVKRWFDAEGKPALGDPAQHAPATSVHPREPQWGEVGVQQVLDTALAWSVINGHFDVADFLLAHGADIDTDWSSHEPASILHELVFHRNYDAMRFLIDRGIDMTILDYRWNSTARGWALYAAQDPRMAQWLEDAEREREAKR